ncbi:effector-associated constant component EACC1 [Streptomyces palmae]|uniref:Uncharacterized protein n=1 Tax=Streptomyces palmae TaxID=1701085 RepID=A0A4Z0HAI9_9ACTN|nr:hypothetical protein [Streptomyces palmae]TGB10327.1 hypothetical protein E4099_12850 [Streptomyces palmae]
MEIRIAVAGPGADQALTSLHRWVSQDRESTRRVRLSLVAASPRPGEMGADLEAISAVVSDVMALGSLLVAVLSWRDSRPNPPAVRLERGGVRVELTGDAADPEAVRRIVEALGEQPANADPPACPDDSAARP